MSKMSSNNIAAMFVAYYFARFDKEAAQTLGFKGHTDAFRKIGEHLGVKDTSIKNMRDEFDARMPNSRKGWHKRKMNRSRTEVMKLLDDESEEMVRQLIRDILAVPGGEVEGFDQLIDLLDEPAGGQKRSFSELRGLTGNAAEAFFMSELEAGHFQFKRISRDAREAGVGYDFEVDDAEYFVEVKGLSTAQGGIMMTDKEWTVAQEKVKQYVLAIVFEVHSNPVVKLIFDPASSLKPNQRIQRVYQKGWHVPASQIKQFLQTVTIKGRTWNTSLPRVA